MTQRIFDIENEEDMKLLWSILPDDIIRLKKNEPNTEYCVYVYSDLAYFITKMLKIDWHDATEITRPVNYEDMIGCVGWFKHHKETIDKCSFFGILDKYNENDNLGRKFYCRSDTWYEYFTPAKKSELKFWEGLDK